MKIPYLDIESLITFELMQRSEEGIDISRYQSQWEKLRAVAGDQSFEEKFTLLRRVRPWFHGSVNIKRFQSHRTAEI